MTANNVFNAQGRCALEHILQQDFAHADTARVMTDIEADFRADVIGMARVVVAEAAPSQNRAFVIFQYIQRPLAAVRVKPRFAFGNTDGRQVGGGLAGGYGAVVNLDNVGQVGFGGFGDGVLHSDDLNRLLNQFGNGFEGGVAGVAQQLEQNAFHIGNGGAGFAHLRQPVFFVCGGTGCRAFKGDVNIETFQAQIQYGLQHADMGFCAD